ncbi:unnamed protein product [Mytilus coruscus]|uniref:Uncharacterized protein n=1 Tax=Mytilus coruscus TaxID=42192 RepID=A0A6J8ACC8_MYTCO|nr:unnamed protein product [Mytilus coruscus]
MEFDNTCLHCQHYFDVNNLKTERGRKLMKHSDVNLIETIANCYQLEENLLESILKKMRTLIICKSFDLPVKKWANKVAEIHNKENSNTKDSSLDLTHQKVPDLSQENLNLPTPMKCGSYGSEELLQTPACKTDLSIDMDSPFTTTIPVEASSESGPFQIVMDN